MSAHQAMYPIRTIARVLKVSASGYYAWRSRPTSARATADADLTRHIRTIHAGSHGTYGAPRVHAELKADGLSVGRKRVSRLMRVAGIAGISRRRSAPITTRQATGHHPATDLARRNFVAERPNELWVADITFLPTLAGFLYLCGRSRRLVAPDRRMGLLGRSEDPRRARCSRHGARGPKARQRRPSFGSRFAIHVGRFRRSLQGSRRSSIDRLGRRRLRQCDVREFLRHPRMRADRSASLPVSQRGADGRLSVHRRLLQSLTPPLGPGLSFAHRIRKETSCPKQACLSPNPSIKAGQLHTPRRRHSHSNAFGSPGRRVRRLLSPPPALAETVTSSVWQGVRTCQGPGGYRSTKTRWNGFTTGWDSEGNRWTTSRWNGFKTTTVRPSGFMPRFGTSERPGSAALTTLRGCGHCG